MIDGDDTAPAATPPASYPAALNRVPASVEDTLLADEATSQRLRAPPPEATLIAVSGQEPTLAGEPAAGSPGAQREMPARIGRYLVIEPLGEGGMGVIFAAYDPQLDRKVAIKLVRPAYTETSGGEAQARLVREAQALARLRHPNIVTVYEVGAFGDEVYVAMEFVDGVTLRTWQFEHARSWREIVRVYLAAGRGLAAAHRGGLVHRDFKPDNVLVTRDGEARVLDFGLAYRDHALAPVGELPASAGESLTMTGALVGTPAYMAPEQFRGGTVDVRTDVFAFSVALYEALYGVRPFAGATVAEICVSLFEHQITPPPPFVRVPKWLRRVALRGIRLDPNERPPDMDAVLRALGRDPARYLAAVSVVLVVGGVITALVLALRSAEGRQSLRDQGARARADFDHRRAEALAGQLLARQGSAAAEQFNAWIVAAARARVEAAPIEALAALKHLRVDGGGWSAARGVAASAMARGVPGAAWATETAVTALAFAGGDRWLITGDARGRIELRARAGGVVASVEHGAAIAGLSVAEQATTGERPGLRVLALGGGAVSLWDVGEGTLRRIGDASEVSGVSGARGVSGPRGVRGENVVSGVKGVSGAKGASGAKGVSGVKGVSGAKGVRGASGASAAIRAAALAPDGERVALGGDDGRTRIVGWAGEPLHSFTGHVEPISALAWARDGQTLASGDGDGRVIVWRLAANSHRELGELSAPVRELHFDDEAERLYAAASDRSGMSWALAEMPEPEPLVGVAAIRVAAGVRLQLGPRGEVSVRHDGAPERRLASEGPALAIGLESTGRWAAVAHARGVEIWDARARRNRRLQATGRRLERLTYSPSGRWLAGATDEGGVQLWQVEGGARTILREAGPALESLFFTADETSLVAADRRPRVIAWPLGQVSDEPRELPAMERAARVVYARPLADGGVLQWHANNFVAEIESIGPDGGRRWSTPAIESLALAAVSADGLRLALAPPRGRTELWRVEGERPVREAVVLGDADHHWKAVAHSADGTRTRLAARVDRGDGSGASFVVWEIARDAGEDGESPTPHVLYEDDAAGEVIVDATAQSVVVLGEGRRHLWQLATGQIDRLPDCVPELRGFALASDGARAVLVGGETVRAASELACVVELATGAHYTLQLGGDPWAWDGRRALASVFRGAEIELAVDPTPEAPEEFLPWLGEQTRRELALAELVTADER